MAAAAPPTTTPFARIKSLADDARWLDALVALEALGADDAALAAVQQIDRDKNTRRLAEEDCESDDVFIVDGDDVIITVTGDDSEDGDGSGSSSSGGSGSGGGSGSPP